MVTQPSVLSKEQLLRDGGYRYDFDRMAYVNRQTRVAMTVEYVNAAKAVNLLCVMSRGVRDEWEIFANQPIARSVRERFVGQLVDFPERGAHATQR